MHDVDFGRVWNHACNWNNMAQILECFSGKQTLFKNHNNKFEKEWLQQFIHDVLKCCRCIAQSEWHYLVFVMPVMSLKSGFRNILCGHAYLVEALEEVKLWKPWSISQSWRSSSILGMGKWSLTVTAIRALSPRSSASCHLSSLLAKLEKRKDSGSIVLKWLRA